MKKKVVINEENNLLKLNKDFNEMVDNAEKYTVKILKKNKNILRFYVNELKETHTILK